MEGGRDGGEMEEERERERKKSERVPDRAVEQSSSLYRYITTPIPTSSSLCAHRQQ